MKAPLVVKDLDDRGKSRSNVHLGIVHRMAERLEHDGQIYEAPVWIRNQHKVNRGGQVSVHAFIRPNGTIVQSIPLERVAWHAVGFNQTSVGCEILVKAPSGKALSYGSFLGAIGIVSRTKQPIENPSLSPYTTSLYRSAG